MDFTKPTLSTNVGKFILDNLSCEKEKKSMTTITKKSEGTVTTNPTPVLTSNSFSPLEISQKTPGTSESVFQKEKEPWELAIEKISVLMVMMLKWQHIQIRIAKQEIEKFCKTLPI